MLINNKQADETCFTLTKRKIEHHRTRCRFNRQYTDATSLTHTGRAKKSNP